MPKALERTFRVVYAITNHKTDLTYTCVGRCAIDGLVAASTINSVEDELLRGWYLQNMGDNNMTAGVELNDIEPLQHFTIILLSMIPLEYNDETGKPYPWTQG